MQVLGERLVSVIFQTFTDLIDLVVVDKNRWIKTCPFSNLVIGNLLDESNITFKPKFNKNIKFVVNELKFIDAERKKILFVDELSLIMIF